MSLQDRAQAIPRLVDHFLGDEWDIESDALLSLERYGWPGNVRQLINVTERAKILADDQTIRQFDLPNEVVAQPTSPTGAAVTGESDNLADIERSHVVDVLARERGNKARAARSLGINRRSLYRLLENSKTSSLRPFCFSYSNSSRDR